MTTLLSVQGTDGAISRCNSQCYNATEPRCLCLCGGSNHGVGKDRAVKNTLKMADQWIEGWATEHEIDREKTLVLSEPVAQGRLPI